VARGEIRNKMIAGRSAILISSLSDAAREKLAAEREKLEAR
jgi:hypothetical protein